MGTKVLGGANEVSRNVDVYLLIFIALHVTLAFVLKIILEGIHKTNEG
jgi:hypothetical protein